MAFSSSRGARAFWGAVAVGVLVASMFGLRALGVPLPSFLGGNGSGNVEAPGQVGVDELGVEAKDEAGRLQRFPGMHVERRGTGSLVGRVTAFVASAGERPLAGVALELVGVVDGREVRESASDRPGDELVVADIGGWPVGLTVCYDLRFPELYRALAVAGAQAFTVPAGFMLHTGRDHWEVLLRARAIENGAYVIAPNQHGSWDGNRMFGRSMIVDPWGVVIANAGDGDGVCIADLEPGRVAAMRAQLPVLTHRRPDVYATAVRAAG